MPSKDTLEDFVKKSQSTHGINKYSYSKVDMAAAKVTITCNRCGEDFQMLRSKHIFGQGCDSCSRSAGKKYGPERYLSLFKEKHGTRFDYSDTVFTDDGTIEVGCPVHGIITTTPRQHLHGSGCKECGIAQKGVDNKITTEHFITKSREHHGDKYDYSLVDMSGVKGVMSKVQIICPVHGVFEQLANDHSKGCGCKDCGMSGGYSSDLPGWLYVLSSSMYTKIGITNRDVPKRLKEINSEQQDTPFELTHAIKFSDGSIPRLLESKLLRYFRANYKQPKIKFDGSTECFIELSADEVLHKIVGFYSS